MLYVMCKWLKLAFNKINASQLVTRKSQNMKINVLLFFVLFSFVFQFQEAQSQDEQGPHTFKIVGSKKNYTPNGIRSVEYDPESNNHLVISNFDKDGNISRKFQYLFTGKKFNLDTDFLIYKDKGEIQSDGSDTSYGKDGAIERTFVYKENKIVSQIYYYPNGQKQTMIPGIYSLNGEYKIWYSNGQLSFSGYYKDNLKDGDFEQFDESGASVKKGVYKEGKLILGEKVIAEINYTEPDMPAKYALGEVDFDQYLTKKALSPDAPRMAFSQKVFYLYIDFDKTGKMTDFKNTTTTYDNEEESIKYLLKDCPAYSPALVEGIPVQSQQRMALLISKSAVMLRQEERVYMEVEEMPEFPGGSLVLRNLLYSNLQYPQDAARSKIQGRVFVNFVIDKEGRVSRASVSRGVHPSLDAEACRVVMSLPNWKPGRILGKPVSVIYTVPVNFMLQ